MHRRFALQISLSALLFGVSGFSSATKAMTLPSKKYSCKASTLKRSELKQLRFMLNKAFPKESLMREISDNQLTQGCETEKHNLVAQKYVDEVFSDPRFSSYFLSPSDREVSAKSNYDSMGLGMRKITASVEEFNAAFVAGSNHDFKIKNLSIVDGWVVSNSEFRIIKLLAVLSR